MDAGKQPALHLKKNSQAKQAAYASINCLCLLQSFYGNFTYLSFILEAAAEMCLNNNVVVFKFDRDI